MDGHGVLFKTRSRYKQDVTYIRSRSLGGERRHHGALSGYGSDQLKEREGCTEVCGSLAAHSAFCSLYIVQTHQRTPALRLQ